MENRKFTKREPLGENFEKFIIGLLFVIIFGGIIKYCEKPKVTPKETPIFSKADTSQTSYPKDRFKKVALILEE